MASNKLISNLVAFWLSATACAVVAQSGINVLERVRSDYVALQSAERDYRHQSANGSLNPREAADYRIYLEGLRDRFHLACSQLKQSDRLTPALKVPCPSNMPVRPAAADIDLTTERTLGEQTGDLDRQLDTALSTFDEMLLREQERVKAATPASVAVIDGANPSGGVDGHTADSGRRDGQGRPGSDTTAEAGEIGEGAGTPDAVGPAVSATTRTGGAATRDGRGRVGRGQPAAGRDQPPDIPDGSDDDVVARQLREAAEQETDPELKKKLWDEYRKYKRGTR